MIKNLFIFLFFCSNFVFSQYDIKIEALILDYKTSKPISLAKVNFKYTSVGTFTNNKGMFSLKYDEKLIGEDDVFIISAKGFRSQEVSASKLYKFYEIQINFIYSAKKALIAGLKTYHYPQLKIITRVYLGKYLVFQDRSKELQFVLKIL